MLGAVEVGMLRALFEAEVTPELVLGTSVGALNGALVARDPTPTVVERLTDLWRDVSESRGGGYADRTLPAVRRAVATGTHLYSAQPMRQRLEEELGDIRFEDLAARLQVCAASIERAAEHWFDSGRVVDAVLASAAVPGLLPPVKVGAEHFLDGGIVNSIPLGPRRAAGRDARVRAPGRPDRATPQASSEAVGGRPGVLRDRPAAPVRP